jgi:hypothetical protein
MIVEVLKLKSKTDSSGSLHVNVGVPDSDVEVTVVLPSAHGAVSDDELKRDWEEFVRRTAGSIRDPKFRRYPQGDYPKREALA